MSRTGNSVYPGTVDSFDRIGTANYEDEVGYDHVNVHNEAMDAIENIQSVIGTTAGTSVLKNYSAGQFVPLTDGWTVGEDTWTYASATTFTIAGVDRTAMFPKGTKIKLTQTTAKYFYVVDSAFSTNTTVTVTGGITYTLANAAITSPYYSYASTPQGFPNYFSYTPAWTNFTIGDAVVVGRFLIIGTLVRGSVVSTFGSTSSPGIGNIGFSVPVSYGVGVQGYEPPGFGYLYDAGTTYPIYLMRDAASATNTRMIRQSDGTNVTGSAPFTIGNEDILRCSFSYLI